LLRSAILPFCADMRRSPVLAGAGLPALAGLVMLADLVDYPAGATIVKAGRPADALLLLARGEARVKFGSSGAESVIEPGSTFGSMLAGRRSEQETVVAEEPSSCLRITRRLLREQFEVSPALRRVAAPLAGHDADSELASVILASGDRDYPVSQLGFFTAATLARDYNDRCAFLRLVPAGSPVEAPSEREGVICAELPVTRESIEAVVRGWRRDHRNIEVMVLDRGSLPWTTVAPLADLLAKVAFVTADTFQEPPLDWRADKIAWCVQLPDAHPKGDPPYQCGAVRVRLDMRRIRSATRLDELSPEDRVRLRRWARFLSERTVGVALGGGGAWGFAHVPLLKLLHRCNIPVDMVTGASFGSLAGAYYCALGEPNWDQGLLEGAEDANRATKTAFFSSRSLERVIDKHLTQLLGHTPRLELLEVPLLPVATNVGAGAEAVIGYGTVGWGARASSSFPGIFTPTTGEGFRYVDGGIVRNVPTDPLAWHGCDLIVASNIVPNPRYERERGPRFPGPIGRWLHEFNLLRRAEDTLRSSLILMHTASDAVSWDADVLYSSPLLDFSPTDLTRGKEIIQAAEPSVAEIERRLRSAWRVVREGRGAR
jgi:predicted acylesterase/phospholipase RssA